MAFGHLQSNPCDCIHRHTQFSLIDIFLVRKFETRNDKPSAQYRPVPINPLSLDVEHCISQARMDHNILSSWLLPSISGNDALAWRASFKEPAKIAPCAIADQVRIISR